MFYRGIPALAALLLQRRHIALLAVAAVQQQQQEKQQESQCSARNIMSAGDASSSKVQNNDRLILYYDQFSYYSQKVVLALHEKNLKFDSKFINLAKSEQYKPWFLELNPLGEVPVLQDTGKIIPDSARIIDYLEDNFSNGDTPRLIPMGDGPEVRQNVTRFRHLLQQAPATALTNGAMLHPQLLKSPKVPFIGPVRKALASSVKNSAKHLRETAEQVPVAREELLRKAARSEESYKQLSEEKNYVLVLAQIEQILDKIEAELATHSADRQDWWLCCQQFTIADVELTILLERINELGLEYYFWTAGKRPHIEQYFARVRQRESYKKTIPGTLVLLKTLFLAQAPILLGVVAAVALVVGGVFIAKRYIS